MKRLALGIIVLVISPAVKAADGDSIDTAIRGLYDVISGPAGPRDWPRFRAMFTEGARLIPTRTTPQGPTITVMTPDDYATRAGAGFEKNAFYESEVSRRLEVFGNVAHAFSTYESRRAPGEKPFARGINSIQLVKTAGGWRIVTVVWDSEREGNPLPEKYSSDSK
jgi:hypothetical protein